VHKLIKLVISSSLNKLSNQRGLSAPHVHTCVRSKTYYINFFFKKHYIN
jgi:hypothetical protein